MTSIQDANNHTTSFTYDAFGRVTKTTFPSGYIETYGYDAVGNLTGKTDPEEPDHYLHLRPVEAADGEDVP